jgi:hypothetical protein
MMRDLARTYKTLRHVHRAANQLSNSSDHGTGGFLSIISASAGHASAMAMMCLWSLELAFTPIFIGF